MLAGWNISLGPMLSIDDLKPLLIARVCLLVAMLAYAGNCFALDPNQSLKDFGRQQWLSESGLPQSTVHAITQTSDGYIWIATEQGLARFDGVSFTIFDTRNTSQFRSNDIRALA